MLHAPPGAGKTTRVPLALLDETWLAGNKIIVLEPRRLAARAAARRMASTLGEPVGERVGYRVHLDSRVGARTRVEVVTEGILTRLLQSDPALEGISLVIFDELHERTLHADLGLALALQTQRILRPELRLLAMSATLDVTPVAELLGGVAAIRSEGRAFPVETRHLPSGAPAAIWRDQQRVEALVVSTIGTALREHSGDMLVFLPGAGEIRRVAERLGELRLGPDVDLAPLYGNLSPDAQDRAILPSRPGRRKVVLATSIAETSLTIEGVRVVIDSGLARVPRFSPRTGMTRLETVRVSRASADQRRGRAGRLAPGVCYRLWPENEEAHLVPRAAPEILEADLAPLALELAAAGIVDPFELSWLDPPPRAALAQARELLIALDAIDSSFRISEQGKQMTRLGVHPRLAHMLVRARELGGGMARLAPYLAALLSERDVLRSDATGGGSDVDVRRRAALLRDGHIAPGADVDHAALHRVRAEAEHLARQLGAGRVAAEPNDDRQAGLLVGLAYPDRVAQRRPGARGRFLLRNGRGAALESHDALAGEDYIAVAAVDDRLPDGRVFLAAPLSRDEIEENFGSQIAEEELVAWDDAAERVVAVRRRRLGAIVLAETTVRDPDPFLVAQTLIGALAKAGVAALPWSEAGVRLRERLAFLHHVDPRWPDVGDEHLAGTLHDWLTPRVVGMRSRQDVARLDLAAALLDLLSWEQRASLDELAPTHVVVPSGSRLPIDYRETESPVLAVRLQEMFGLADTPRVARGRVPLTLHLLSPAHRPVQVTRDLAGFWRTSYFDVRKDLRGRYPKHPWPDDPLTAPPTSRAKRKS